MTSKAVIFAAITTLLLPEAAVWAADRQDVDELRSEVRQLQAQVQAMRSAVAELSELDRREAAALTKAFGVGPAAPESTPAPLVARAETETPANEPTSARASSVGTDRPARPSRHRRHRHRSRR